MSDAYFMHYGVKGMKWGVRKEIANKTSSGIKGAAELAGKFPGRKYREAQRVRSAEAKGLSDAELRTRINRIQMEKQYVQLTTEDTKRGFNAVKALEVAGSLAAIAASVFGIIQGVNNLREMKQE